MKFSDMMGKGDKGSAVTDESTEVESVPAAEAPTEVAEAPIRFGGVRSDAPAEAAVVEPIAATRDYALRDVVSELAPSNRNAPAVASDQELDATSWLEGLNTIDDDLLPR